MGKQVLAAGAVIWTLSGGFAQGQEAHDRAAAADHGIAAQPGALSTAAPAGGFGPQSPRDLAQRSGRNDRAFAPAPRRQALNLCNIHFHENAEHRGGEFTTAAGNGDGHGNGAGFKYDGVLTAAELAPVGQPIGQSEHGDLVPGDTVEIHFVHSSAQARPGATLAACFTEAIKNPQLRVEAVVAVLVNDPKAANMRHLGEIAEIAGYYQAPNLPDGLGRPINYAGSTTGPSYNLVASPYQVTWSVRPKVVKIDIASMAAWLADNPFEEAHAHGVRTLVTDPARLSAID